MRRNLSTSLPRASRLTYLVTLSARHLQVNCDTLIIVLIFFGRVEIKAVVVVLTALDVAHQRPVSVPVTEYLIQAKPSVVKVHI